MRIDSKWLRQMPSLMIGTGILLATLVDEIAPLTGSRALVGAFTMSAAMLGADVTDSLVRYGVTAVSWGAILLSSGFLVATWIFRASTLAGLMIPSIGAIGWVLLLGKFKGNGKRCKLF